MEADDQSSDDEVFVGEVTDRERQHPAFSSRRRTTLYFPGISRPDSSVSIFKEVTDDGTLIFSCENSAQTDTGHSAVKQMEFDSKNPSRHLLRKVGSLSQTWEGKQADSIGLSAGNGDGGQMVSVGNKSDSVPEVDHLSAASESGYGSTSDASFSGGLASPPSLVSAESLCQMPEVKENIAVATTEDRKRKHCQIVSSETVRLHSPHLLISPGAQRPDFTGAPSVKSSAHGGTSAWTTPGVAFDSPYNQNALLQSSESAFSKLHLKSQQFEPKRDTDLKNKPSPIIKDFPKRQEEEGVDNPCRVPRMKRKIVQISPPTELRIANQNENKTESGEEISCTLSPPKTENESNSDSQHLHFGGTPSSSGTRAVRSTGQQGDCNGCGQSSAAREPLKILSPWDRAVSAGGDAQGMRLSKVPRVFVPETPEVASSASSSSRLKFGSPPKWEECESVPSSQLTAQEAYASPNLNPTSALAECSALTNRMSKAENTHTPLSTSIPAFRLSQATPFSPDLFTSPVYFDRSSSAQAPATIAPVYSPIPGSSASSKLKSVSKSKSLQPIQEDGTEAFDSCSPSAPAEPAAARDCESHAPEKPKRAKYPPLRRRAPASVNKENVDTESASFIFPSPVFAQSDRTPSASEQISACSNNGKDDSSSTALISSPSVSAVDQQKGTLPQKPKYHGMTFADLQEYLQNGATSRGIAPQGTPLGVKSVRPLPTEVELEDSRAAMTRVNTMINGETRHSLLDPQSSPALLTEFPAPKEATRVSWSDTLAEETGVQRSPVKSAVTPRSILLERPVDREFPFSKDPPSPILLTRKRLSKWPMLFNNSS